MNLTDVPNKMLIDIQYNKSKYSTDKKDYLYIIWKDLDTNIKHLTEIPNPQVDIYFEKPEYRDHKHNKGYTELYKVNKVSVPFANKTTAIAREIGPSAVKFVYDCFREQRYTDLQQLTMWPYVFASDYDIRPLYRYEWKQKYSNDLEKPITKGFLDIEVDLTNATGFPSAMKDPIDLISFLDSTHKHMYTFILSGIVCYENPTLSENRIQLQEYYRTHEDELIQKAHAMFDENYPDMEYSVYFYDSELDMLCDLFKLINKLKLDFIGIWNMRFDICYIIDRIKTFGIDPSTIMCDDDFSSKMCYYNVDYRHYEVKNQTDAFFLSSYTVWWCQMRTYAAIRKGQSELRDNKLNTIAKAELNDEKLNYDDEGDLKTLSLTDWLKYFLYNIKDVLLQDGINEKTSDLNTYYFSSYENITPYQDEFKQTVVLRNVQYESYLSQGLVPGNNINVLKNKYETETLNTEDEDDDDVGYEGALVGNPVLNGYFGLKMYGKRTNNIFKYSIDFDMSAFYPSCIRAGNIDPSTLLFKIIILPEEYDVRGGKIPYHGITSKQMLKTNKDSFAEDIAKEVLDNFQTAHYLSFGYKWLNLPSVNEMEELLKKVC